MILCNIYFVFKYLLLEKKITLKNTVKNKYLNSGVLIIIEIGILIILNYYLKINFYENVKGDEIALNYNTAILTINKYAEKPSEIIKVIESFYNFTRGLEIYIGLVAIVSAIYIYCIGFTDTFKKNILIFLMGEEKILLILVSILLFYFFNIPSIYFISLTVILFYFLYKAIKLIFLIMNHRKFEEVFFSKIVPKFKEIDEGNGLDNLYQEIQVNLYQAIVDKNLIRVEELLTFLKQFLIFQEDENENNNSERIEYPEEKLILFFYKCYKHLIEVPDINVLLALSNISIYLGDFYLERKDYKKAQSCYSLIELNYEYYIKNYKEDIFLNIGSSLFSSLGSKNSDILEEVICHESALLKLIHKIIQIEDYKNLREFLVFYNLDILREGINKKIKIYSYIVIIYFLKEKQSIKYKESKERLELLQELSNNIICFVDNDILQEIYELQKKENLEKKMGIHYLKFPRFDFQGISGYTSSGSEIIKEIFIQLNELQDNLNKEFILSNIETLEYISKEYNLKFIKSELSRYEMEIAIEKAKKYDSKKIDEKKLNENLEIIEVEEKNIKVNKLLEKISVCPLQKIKIDNSEEKTIERKITLDNNFINSSSFRNFSLQVIEDCMEVSLIKKINKKLTKIHEKIKLSDFIILTSKTTYLELKRKYSKEINISNIYFIKNFLEKEDCMVYLIKKKSIFQSFYKTSLTFKELGIEELGEIKGFCEEERRIKLQGKTKVIYESQLEIIYNDDCEIYEIEDIYGYLKD